MFTDQATINEAVHVINAVLRKTHARPFLSPRKPQVLEPRNMPVTKIVPIMLESYALIPHSSTTSCIMMELVVIHILSIDHPKPPAMKM